MGFILHFAISIVICFVILPISVAQGETPSLYELSLKELLQVEVTVASKFEEPVLKAPSSVTVFYQREIKRLNVDTLEDLLNFVPGFQSWSQVSITHSHATSVRGRVRPDNPEILFLIDGMRLNEHSSGSKFTSQLLPLEHLDRVEVIRGPGSALYGSNAFLGVVNLVTNKSSNDVNIAIGSNQARKYSVNHGYGDESQGYKVFASRREDDGEKFNDIVDPFGEFSSTQDPYLVKDASIKGWYRNFFIDILLHEAERYDYFITGRVFNDLNVTESTNYSVNLGFTISDFYDWNGEVSLSYKDKELSNLLRLFPQGVLPFNPQDDWVIGGEFHFSSWNFQGSIDRALGNKHRVQIGWEYEHFQNWAADNISNYDAVTFQYHGHLVQHSSEAGRFHEYHRRIVKGVYVQDSYTPTDSTTLTLGVRYDNYNDVDHAVNTRFALVHEFSTTHLVKFLYGEAFRPPSYNELYLQNNVVLLGNKSLDAEEIHTYELSYIGTYDNSQIGLNIFRNEIENTINVLPIGDVLPDGSVVTQYQNTKDQVFNGAEIELMAELTESLLIRFNYSHVFSDVDPTAPDTTMSAYINYQYKNTNINVNGFSRRGMEALKDSSLAILNLKIRQKLPLEKDINVYMGIKNLLDEEYNTYGFGEEFPEKEVPARGREWFTGVELNF